MKRLKSVVLAAVFCVGCESPDSSSDRSRDPASEAGSEAVAEAGRNGSILIVGCTSGILIGSAWAERLLARGQRDARPRCQA